MFAHRPAFCLNSSQSLFQPPHPLTAGFSETRVLLYSPGRPWTHSNPLALISRVLGLQAYTTIYLIYPSLFFCLVIWDSSDCSLGWPGSSLYSLHCPQTQSIPPASASRVLNSRHEPSCLAVPAFQVMGIGSLLKCLSPKPIFFQHYFACFFPNTQRDWATQTMYSIKVMILKL